MGTLKSVGFKAVGMVLHRLGILGFISRLVDRLQKKTGSNAPLPFPLIQKRVSRPIQILMYHGIDDAWSPFLGPAPIRGFRNQLRYLAESCNVLDLGEAVERIQKRDVPHRAVVITLDDGYRDSYVNAFPLLREMELSATIFLATAAIGTGKVLWHDRACWMISQTTVSSLEGFGSRIRYELNTREGKRAAQEGVLWYLRSLEDQDRIDALEQLSTHLQVSGEPDSEPRLMLNWEEVNEMYQSGIRFGAHTVHHPILSKIPLSDVASELRESKETIERHVGCRVTTFAYPSGRPEDYNSDIKGIVKQEGFACAVSTVTGANYEGDDLFDLKRVGYWDQDIGPFGLRFEYSRFCA
ncbi:MAG: polysaccharide deacetylase [Nitrospirales bacterium]|nr:MAG: polysaccharide deacetylase [Nitrospirales bacterium]